MTFIVYERTDGQVAIATVVEGADIEGVVRNFRNAHPGEFPKFTVHETLEMPGNREHRDAWKRQGNKIVVDTSKIKHKEKTELERLSEEIEKLKQALKDLPGSINNLKV